MAAGRLNIDNMYLKNLGNVGLTYLTLSGVLFFQMVASTQTPLITIRLANAQIDCVTQEYCLNVEAKANMTGQEIFGVNVRFFYDDDVLEFIDFRDFQGGYGPVAPDPPIISTSAPAGPALFNFAGPAEFVNGAMQLTSSGPPPIILDTSVWSQLFQICFFVDDQSANLDTFCPSVVWDLEQDPQDGGFLSGDDGVVITIVDPDPNGESLAAFEGVEQYNWMYIGNGSAPYGQPEDSDCSNINCALPLTLLDFEGEPVDGGNLLRWQTEDEINLAGFQVMRSSDGLSWKHIFTVDAEEVNSGINRYAFLDNNPPASGNFYRLEILDNDGRARQSRLIYILTKDFQQEQELLVYPNPSSQGTIFISFPEFMEQNGSVKLLDASGQIVLKQNLDHSGMELDISRFTPGTYFVWVISGGKSLFKALIIE